MTSPTSARYTTTAHDPAHAGCPCAWRPAASRLGRHALGALLALAWLVVAPGAVQAEARHDAASDDTLLRVIDRRESPVRTVEFSRADLDALEPAVLETTTVVTDGVQRFEGVRMRELLRAAGIEHAETIVARALNDYEIRIPVQDFRRYDVLAALVQNGERLTRRDKGPIWIAYPRDDHGELQDIRYDYRWVWQLTEIEVPAPDTRAEDR